MSLCKYSYLVYIQQSSVDKLALLYNNSLVFMPISFYKYRMETLFQKFLFLNKNRRVLY